jgi:hypothetical protein
MISRSVPVHHQSARKFLMLQFVSMQPEMKLSRNLRRLGLICRRPGITFGEVFHHAKRHGPPLVILIAALPFAVPIPLPGLSIPAGIIICATSLRMFWDGGIWIPKRFENASVPGNVLSKVFTWSSKLARKVECYIRPRCPHLLNVPVQRLTAFLIFICGALLALPLPPGTNLLPGLSAVFLSLAVLRSDVLILGAGYLIFGANLAFFAMLAILGTEGLQRLLSESLRAFFFINSSTSGFGIM